MNDNQEPFDLDRRSVDIQVGAMVQQNDTVFRITQLLDFDSVIAVNIESGRSAPLRVKELKPVNSDDISPVIVDTSDIADEDWSIAEKRYSIIQPFTKSASHGRKEVEARAEECNVNAATIYRWLKRYKAYGSVSALVPKQRGWKAGNNRIDVSAECVIEEVINKFFLTIQRPTAQKAVLEVKRLCLEREIEAPSAHTIRARINNISERERLRKRGYREKAINKFMPAPGKFPNANYPLSVIQIDHTPADIILVDDVYRKPIGRPWITLAMDVYSRMVTGYYLSFDAPSEASVAMCVAHSMIPKEEWLLLHNVESDWPVWGTPNTIHVDNGADFRSNNFQNSCHMYSGIHLEFRPVKQPRYGGHIERLLGTLLKEMHDLPGTTFSSIAEKDEYNAEKNATMTKTEFEEWLVTLICKVYHKRKHSSIGMSPLKMWENGIFGNADIQGVGMPSRPQNRHTILLDFLPAFKRTVQTFGVTIDGMTYYAESLRPWINAHEPDNKSKKRQLVFRRDPRDISYIWFYDPDLTQYFKVPLADQSLPPLSIWECNQAKEELKKQGTKFATEPQLLRAITELRTKVTESQEKTKKARRQAQRRKEHEKNISPANPIAKPSQNNISLSPISELLVGDVDAFGDVE